MGKFWLLFDNGNHYSVNCSIWPSKPGSPRPADAFIVSESQGDFTMAARTAALAAYTNLKSVGKILSPFTAGVELVERTNFKTNIAGESGGLLFAIAIASAALEMDMPDIAATGVITADGEIKKVKGLLTKLETAATLVGEKGFIFYPKENNETIPHELNSLFKEEKICCHGVSDIGQVFEFLIPSQKTQGISKRLVFLILGLIMAGAMGYVFLYADINDFAFWKTSSDHKITKTCNTAQPVKPPLSETKNVVENKGFD